MNGASSPTYLIGRVRVLPALVQLGRVEVVQRGPSVRRDRTYTLFRVTPVQMPLDSRVPIASTESQALQR